jgi:hypothetical protein
MAEDSLKKLIHLMTEEDLMPGHLQRFKKRLKAVIPIEQKLWSLQRSLTAASIAALIAGTLIFLALFNHSFSNPLLARSSSDLYETEIYMKDQIALKLEILSKSKKIDRELLKDLIKVDEPFKSMQKDLKKNPGDMRLIAAVLETYQAKIDFLDEVLEKSR